MKYLNLIRYKNLLLLAFMQLIFRYGFLKQQEVWLSLSDFQYILLVLATVLIAAGGYIINDIFDQEVDEINKPNKVIIGKQISESNAYGIYAGLTITGVSIGLYLSNVIEKPGFISIFIFIAALLYFYATTLKQIAVVGNLVVSFLLSFSVLIIGFFDLYPATYDGNMKQMSLLFGILKDFALFAFMINFIREIVKDAEDIIGDKSQEMKTLPVVIGINATSKIILLLLTVSISIFVNYFFKNIFNNDLNISSIYCILFILSPLIYCWLKAFSAKEKADFSHLSLILKWIIFFGILSVAIITFNIKQNAI